MDCRCHNSFLLFCRLLVLSERTVASFRRHVAFHFYPLEGLNIATCYHANNFQRDNIVEINRSQEEGKGRYAPLSLSLPYCFGYAEKSAYDKNNNKITGGLS